MEAAPLKILYWHGNSLAVLRQLPRPVRIAIGSELYLLQSGERPLHCKPIKSVGRRVWEVRVARNREAFRVFYILKRLDEIHVLHVFQKKTRKTARRDIETGRSMLRKLLR
jgi:phage-related protein